MKWKNKQQEPIQGTQVYEASFGPVPLRVLHHSIPYLFCNNASVTLARRLLLKKHCNEW